MRTDKHETSPFVDAKTANAMRLSRDERLGIHMFYNSCLTSVRSFHSVSRFIFAAPKNSDIIGTYAKKSQNKLEAYASKLYYQKVKCSFRVRLLTRFPT